MTEKSNEMLILTMMAAIKALFESHPNPERLRAYWGQQIRGIEGIADRSPNPGPALAWAKALLGDLPPTAETPPHNGPAH